jgi:hypothetical protein
MIEGIAALVSLLLAYGMAVVISRTFFGDAHEGFRIVYQWIATTENMPSDAEPTEPRTSLGAQIVFVAVLCLILLASFPCVRYWLGKIL